MSCKKGFFWAFLGLFALAAPLGAQPAPSAPVTVANPRCEYRADPLGIEAHNPRLSWRIRSTRRALVQAAYQILVASTPELLARDQADLWDSGKVASAQSLHVPYGGKPRSALAQSFWKVRVWPAGADAPTTWSSPAHWTMGLTPADWKAKWIMFDTGASAGVGADGKPLPPPLPILRKGFTVAKPVKRALVSLCGLGHYELSLNGNRVGDNMLDPGWTNYRKSCLYTTYDVTAALQSGPNALGVMLGNGMYNVTGGRYVKFKGSFGPPKLILQLQIEYADGSAETVVSDESWKGAAGPVRFSCIYGGEDYDARLEQDGWNTPAFDDKAWKAAAVTEGPGGRLVAQAQPPVKVMYVIPSGAKASYPKGNIRVYNYGQNFSGWPNLTVKGPAGSKIRMTPGELLDEQGLVSQRSAGGGPTIFTYTLKGQGEESWRPRFTYYGFRYLQVELLSADDRETTGPLVPKIQRMGGDLVFSSAFQSGRFVSSEMLLTRIHTMIECAMRANMHSVMTDCPHREKLGWLEETHLLGRPLMFNFELPTLYAKISRDMAEAQTPEGLVPDIAPEYVVFKDGFRDSPEWGSAVVINPWLVYQMYGDPQLLKDHYDEMAKYVAYLGGKAKDGIIAYGLGDWYDVGPKRPGVSQLTSKGVTATAVYYQDLEIMRQAAELLGRKEDARKYADLAARTREAFNRAFFNPATNQYDRGSQTAAAMPLTLGLAPKEKRAAILKKLIADIRAGKNRVTAGDVGFHYLVAALTEAGRDDVLYDMVTQDDGPGYVDQLKKKATTLTEAWDANPSASQNHFMLGHADDWFYTGVGGITPTAPGFKEIRIKPAVLDKVEWTDVNYESLYGLIKSQWKRENGVLRLELSVPPNTTATAYIPAKKVGNVSEGGKPATQAEGAKFLRQEGGAAVFALGSGDYAFEVKE